MDGASLALAELAYAQGVPLVPRIHMPGERPERRRRRHTCSNIVEVSTTGFDPARVGVGSSYAAGSPHGSRLFVPPAPTLNRFERYLFALCGHNVPRGEVHHWQSFRQKLILQASFDVQGQPFTRELPVTTPDWAFEDANVMFEWRFLPGGRQVPVLGNTGTNPANHVPSSTTNPYGAFSALLFVDSPVVRYIPPSSGQPPGRDVEGSGTIFDIRNPWDRPNPIFDTELVGPGDLIMYCSVWQTDPDTRPIWVAPPGFDLGALVPEDRFVQAFQSFADVRYGFVAGAMTIRKEPQ